MNSLLRLRLSIYAIIILLLLGTLGYRLIENWSILDSVYMTVMVLATIGIKEVGPLSEQGKAFTIVLTMIGITGIAVAFGTLVEVLVSEDMRHTLRRRRMDRQIAEMKDHYIVCGYGRMGQQIVRDFIEADASFVVVENNPEQIPKLVHGNIPHVEGDASDDETLTAAGIKKARGLIAVGPTDSDNIYISLTAKSLNPNLYIVARSTHEETQDKLYRAGADEVISPYIIGGRRMAAAILRPNVIDLLDTQVAREHLDLQLSELSVAKGSCLCNQTLRQSQVRTKTGAMVIAIKSGGGYKISPPSDTLINCGDTLIASGSPDQIDSLKTLCEKASDQA